MAYCPKTQTRFNSISAGNANIYGHVMVGNGASISDRWRVLHALENILQEIHQSVGAKINSKLNATKPELPKDKV